MTGEKTKEDLNVYVHGSDGKDSWLSKFATAGFIIDKNIAEPLDVSVNFYSSMTGIRWFLKGEANNFAHTLILNNVTGSPKTGFIVEFSLNDEVLQKEYSVKINQHY